MVEALARELAEEGNVEILEPPVLHGLFFNSRVSQHDHVALFIAPSVSIACRYPIERLPHTAFFLSTFFLRIRVPDHAPTSPRSCWAHLFQNGGDEMGARWSLAEQG
jgi:hypothetical protein